MTISPFSGVSRDGGISPLQTGISGTGISQGPGAVPVTYATWNPADVAGYALSNGDLTIAGGSWALGRITISKDADEWCAELTVTNTSSTTIVGVASATAGTSSFCGSDSQGYGYYSNNGNLMHNGGGSAFGSTWNVIGTIIGIKFNATTRFATWYKNGVQVGSPVDVSALTGAIFIGFSGFSGGDIITLNAGQTAMTYDYSSANVGIFV